MIPTPSGCPFDLVDEWGPEKVICVSDTRTGMRGVLVIDNTARGIGKGGTRMLSSVTVHQIARLARVMTLKWASVDMFYGGAKAGIVADPASPDKEAILRAFARALSNEVPAEYVFGLDMGLTEDDGAILLDELGPGSSVGTPYTLGGLPYDQLGITGYGVAEAASAAIEFTGRSVEGAQVVVQGFGAVGAAAAERLRSLGAVVVAISTSAGTLYDPQGLDVPLLLELRRLHGDQLVDHYCGVSSVPLGSELALECDVLVPAATQDVIDAELARTLQASVVVEGANLPTSPEAQAILSERGRLVVPDFVANAGGVVAAGYAMDARYSGFRPDPEPVFSAVATKIRTVTRTVLESAFDHRETPHASARRLAQERVRDAMVARGRLPRTTSHHTRIAHQRSSR